MRLKRVRSLTLPTNLPHSDAMKGFGGGMHSYEPDFWELEYHTYRYLGRMPEGKLVRRHQQIVRNMETLITPKRDVIPIESFLSSWYWFRKEHQTRCEFSLRDKMIEPPRMKLRTPASRNADSLPRPRHLNAGDVLFRYGKEERLRSAHDRGALRVFPASKQKETASDEARFDDECLKTRYMPGEYVQMTAPNGRALSIKGDVTNSVSGPDYYMLSMSCDWDPALFDDFSGSDACLIVTNAEKFAERLEATAQTMLPTSAWRFYHNPVEYFDPYEQVTSAYFHSAGCKDFRFAYQREYRFLWFPVGEQHVEPFKDFTLGSLQDVTELRPKWFSD